MRKNKNIYHDTQKKFWNAIIFLFQTEPGMYKILPGAKLLEQNHKSSPIPISASAKEGKRKQKTS